MASTRHASSATLGGWPFHRTLEPLPEPMSGRGTSEVGVPDDRARTAVVVVLVSVLFEVGGVLLLGRGGLLTVFGIVVIMFGVMGLLQAVAIAFGRYEPGGGDEDSRRDDGSRQGGGKSPSG